MMPVMAHPLSRTVCLMFLLYFVSFVVSQDNSTNDESIVFNFALCGAPIASKNFMTNLRDLLIHKLPAEGRNSLYYNSSVGQPPNKANAYFLCKFDIGLQACKSCANRGMNLILQSCNQTTEAIIWYDDCWVQYSSLQSLSSTLMTRPIYCFYLPQNGSAPADFTDILAQSFNKTASMAISDVNKYASQTINISRIDRLYTSAQCIPDLSTENCRACLETVLNFNNPICRSRRRLTDIIITPSCAIRYKLFSAYE